MTHGAIVTDAGRPESATAGNWRSGVTAAQVQIPSTRDVANRSIRHLAQSGAEPFLIGGLIGGFFDGSFTVRMLNSAAYFW